MKTIDILYNEYVSKCKKLPKPFSEWIIIYYKIKFHKEIIRPQILWYNQLNYNINDEY